MPDLSVLSGVEFEELCRDLLAAELGVPVASFAAGPDSGVDLRWTTVSGRQAVGQCKHYARSGFDTLLRSLRGHELTKVQALAPDEYWVATSVEMTPERKEKIYELFRAWMPSPDCVLGAHDIEGLLRRHPEVLRYNLKLLLGDSERLAIFLHSDVYNRTADRIERINESLPVYVVTQAHQQARALLTEHRVCIVSGEPGAGKSTLAQMLVAEAIHDGYELIDVGDGIGHAWSMLRPGAKQVFFYDDFLGELRFDWLGRDIGDVVRFVERVARSSSTLLVMTTREYILRDAQRVREKLGRLDPNYRFLLDVGQLSPDLAARILFNHLWHAGLPTASLEAIATADLSEVVRHEAFNPRVIETCTRRGWVGDGTGYAVRLRTALDHPDEVWENAFTEYLDDSTRLLLCCIALLPRYTEPNHLAGLFEKVAAAAGVPSGDSRLRHGLAVLEESFIRVHRDTDRTWLQVQPRNPSITAFVLRRLCRERALLRALMASVDDVWLLRDIPFTLSDDTHADPAFTEGVRQDFVEAIVRLDNAKDDPGSVLLFASTLPLGWSPGRAWLEDAVDRYILKLRRARKDTELWEETWHLLLAFVGDPLQPRLHAAIDDYLSPFGKSGYGEDEWFHLVWHLRECEGGEVSCSIDLREIKGAFEYYGMASLSAGHEHLYTSRMRVVVPRDLGFAPIEDDDPESYVDELRRELGFDTPHPNQLALFEIPEFWATARASGFDRHLEGPYGRDDVAERTSVLFRRLVDHHDDGRSAVPHESGIPNVRPLSNLT